MSDWVIKKREQIPLHSTCISGKSCCLNTFLSYHIINSNLRQRESKAYRKNLLINLILVETWLVKFDKYSLQGGRWCVSLCDNCGLSLATGFP